MAEEQILDAALECFARFGVSKTTVEDVAQVAGCSRATLYRYFPGKKALLDGVMRAEIRRLGSQLDEVAAEAATLEELAVGVLCWVGDEFERHAALRHVLTVEPEVVLPHLTFDEGNRVIAVGSLLLAPHLFRFLAPEQVAAAGEWLARLALNYLCSPSEYVSLTDEESVRRLVRTFVLPGLEKSSACLSPGGQAA